ncbi:NAD(P)/FAD-dependent oxidoreductase [Metallibacterium sp.]|uniref:NAD(P)/FAD-dependent oxidoreductase n=1 Tax=Metallibacterium sp. TaxID=2940281 RepID=UPI002607E3B4|nr:NAD(P)/FAD-dependent oxidoreductase [Metallibacterium sp.]
MTTERHRLVIVVGGAGGLELASRLSSRRLRKRLQVTLVDARRTHLWKPLLHEVAAGSFDPAEHALEYMVHATRHGIDFRLGTMERIDRSQHQVWLAPVIDREGNEILARRSVAYDTLVLAVGSVANDFGVPGVAEHCWFLDTLHEAKRFQRRLLDALLRFAGRTVTDPAAEFRVAIVGGGATGVELAAQLHRVSRVLAQYGLEALQPERRIRISVLESGPRILPGLPPRMSASVTRELERIGISVLVEQRVIGVDADALLLADGSRVEAEIKVWAAGIRGPECLLHSDGLELNRIRQLVVRRNLLTTRDDHIFALGDCAAFPPDAQGRGVPPRAQAAHQQANFATRAVRRRLHDNNNLGEYHYRDYGSLVALGHYSTVGNLMGAITGNIWISGFVARLMYVSLYKLHQAALYGWWHTLLLGLANRLRRTVDPEIKLH